MTIHDSPPRSELPADVPAVLRTLRARHAQCSEPHADATNADYGAQLLTIDGLRARMRSGRVTPRKVGLFVAVWERADDGTTRPFAHEGDMELLLVIVRDGARLGLFTFPREALREHGILSVAGEGGKRGFRLYPPWSETSNAQAQRTQRWQQCYFEPISELPA
ncbi:MAG: MepB family protein [Microterricola sp.]